MSEQKIHQLFQILFVFSLLVFLLLLVLQPVFGVLWVLLLCFCLVIVAARKPHVWNVEKNRISSAWNRLRQKLFSAPADEARQIGFTPDHELVRQQAGQNRSYLVDRETFLIGRGSKCDCVLGDAPTVGREHCRIIFRKYSQEYYIEDLRSANGTYLGTRRLEPFTQEKLLDNSEIIIGSCHFLFKKR